MASGGGWVRRPTSGSAAWGVGGRGVRRGWSGRNAPGHWREWLFRGCVLSSPCVPALALPCHPCSRRPDQRGPPARVQVGRRRRAQAPPASARPPPAPWALPLPTRPRAAAGRPPLRATVRGRGVDSSRRGVVDPRSRPSAKRASGGPGAGSWAIRTTSGWRDPAAYRCRLGTVRPKYPNRGGVTHRQLDVVWPRTRAILAGPCCVGTRTARQGSGRTTCAPPRGWLGSVETGAPRADRRLQAGWRPHVRARGAARPPAWRPPA